MSRVLLITGSSGIAAATAKLATGRGDVVFMVGKESSECEELSAELEGSGFFVADVADERAVKNAVGSCLSHFGRIDALFNVAGLSGRPLGDGPLHECSTAAWRMTSASPIWVATARRSRRPIWTDWPRAACGSRSFTMRPAVALPVRRC